jgi:hypothetical protein
MKPKKLKTLDEANSIAMASHSFNLNEPCPNGIACPKCGEELYDSNPMIVLASYPAQKNVACMKEDCGYTGYRFI